MAKNLTQKTASPGIEHFYTAIHARMVAQETETRDVRPTVREFAEALIAHEIRPVGTALDAGCGATVAFALACAKHGFQSVQGIDLNRDSLHYAQTVLRGSGGATVQLSCGSLLSMPFADESFDFAACSGVVHHTPDPEQAIRELARVLKPNGTLYISVYCFADSFFEIFVRMLRWFGMRIPFHRLHGLFRRSQIWNNFLLDHMYVPILWLYEPGEMRQVLENNHLAIVTEWTSCMDPFRRWGAVGRLVSGGGLMRVWLCRKNRTGHKPDDVTSAAGS
jgi:SAM-dependent methyltransferase